MTEFPSQQTSLAQSLFDTVPDPMIVMNAEGIILSANRAVSDVFGWEPKALEGQSVNCLMPSDFAKHHDGYLKRYLETGESKIIGVGREAVAMHKSGRIFPIHLSVGHCKVGDEHLFTGLIRDLSTQHKVQQLIARHERIMEGVLNSPEELIIVFDEAYKVVLVNDAMIDFLEQPRDGVLGRRLADFISSELAFERERIISEVFSTGQTVRFTDSRKGIYLDTQMSPVLDDKGKVEFVTAFSRDITQIKSSKARLLKESKRAEQANRAKTEFLANMSHELRTPLNSVLGFTQFLKEDEGLNDDQQDSVKYIHDAGLHLKNLIEDILDLARIEGGNLTVIPALTDVVEVLSEVVDLSSQKVAARKLVLETEFVDGLKPVFADRTRLKQVFINFIDNAVKYNVHGGSIQLSVSRENDDWARIRIKDTGVGISEENLERLFEPFNRLGYESSGIPGTGIGLVLSRRLIEAMGGHVEVISEENKGSQFDIVLPLADVDEKGMYQADETIPLATQGHEEVGLNLLYIEDNESNISLMRRFVDRRKGWQLTVAREGLEGFQLAQTLLPDVILLDINLTDINGLELAVMMNSTESLQHIPIIAVTADGTEETRQACEYAGIHLVHTKPVDFVALENTLLEIVS